MKTLDPETVEALTMLGFELAQAIVKQSDDGVDRSEFIMKKAIQYLCVWGLGDNSEEGEPQ